MKYAGLLLLAVITVGCVASSPDARRRHLQAGLEDREILVFEAVHHWYQQYRNPKFAYQFDERDGSFSDAVKNRIAAVIPEFERKGDGAFFYVSVPKIIFPEAPFGYVEVIVGDPFYAERYVEVFEKKEDVWQIIDSVTIASGTLDAIITEFNWPIYFRDLKNRRPNQPVQRNASKGSVSNLKSPTRRG